MSLNTLPRVGAQIQKEMRVFWPFMVGGAALIVGLHNLPVTDATVAESPYKKELDLAAKAELQYPDHPKLNVGFFDHKKQAKGQKQAAHH